MNMNTNPSIADVMHARQMTRWMSLGVMPSQENALKAQAALKDYAAESEFNPSLAIRVTGAVAIGVMPSEENCRDAQAQINQVLDEMREVDGETLRNNYRERG